MALGEMATMGHVASNEAHSTEVAASPAVETSLQTAEEFLPERHAPPTVIPNSMALDEPPAESHECLNVVAKVSETPTNKMLSVSLGGNQKRSYIFPWNLCCSWKGMQELIKTTFSINEDECREIQEGTYELRGPKNAIILPELWETLVEPDWEISIYLSSQRAGDSNNSTSMNQLQAKAPEGSGVVAESSKTITTNKMLSTSLKGHQKQSYLFPWKLCCSWNDMQKLIKSIFSTNEDECREIQEGTYELRGPKNAIILPQFWETLVEPGWEISVYLSSQPFKDFAESGTYHSHSDSDSDSDDSVSEDKPRETTYEAKVRYTVDYYQRSGWGDDFLYSSSYGDPVVLEESDRKPETLPVLEERKKIVCEKHRDKPKDSNKEGSISKPEKLQFGDRITVTSLYVHSQPLLNAIRCVIKYTSEAPQGDDSDNLKDGRFEYPFKDLLYHKDDLVQYKQNHGETRGRHSEEYIAQCSRHIEVLVNYLYSHPGIRLRESEAKWSKKNPTTTFGSLWLLLKPGSDVYVRHNGTLNPYVVEYVGGGVSRGIASRYSVLVWNLDFDGNVIRRRSESVEVPVFDGEREISSLPVFPTRFQENGEEFRKQLIERGKKFFACAKGPAFRQYTGVGMGPGRKKYKRARVVIDHTSQPWKYGDYGIWDSSYENIEIGARARLPSCQCSQCESQQAEKEIYVPVTYRNYDDIKPEETGELSEHQYFLCSSHMFGFILKDRSYDLLDLYDVEYPDIVEDAIDKLVMRPETNKDTIKAIAKTYTEGSGQYKAFAADFIQGKGEGQIILLHGPPGTGKTLTAESVAEFARRPLLGITAADLGHDPDKLEQNLLRFFKDAHDWDAVVLLDEADVYLERRSPNDLKRNSIVSIFLRALDYFQGILFLTSNRVGQFDEAFMSRIHVQIGYEPLDDDARRQIWDNFFRKLKEDFKRGGPEIDYEYDAKEYVKKSPDVRNLKWNGREIRNAFQTGVALAVFDARMNDEKKGLPKGTTVPQLRENHFVQVVSMSTAFKAYMISTHEGLEDSELAYKTGIRDDEFGKGNDRRGSVEVSTKRS